MNGRAVTFVVVVAAALGWAASSLRADPAPGRSRWEYKAETLASKDPDVAPELERRLAARSAEGWEYAGWVPLGNTLLLRRAR